jgi:hypothetical protein
MIQMNKKMILSVLIVFLILLGILYTNPEVSGFFSSLTGIAPPVEINAVRNVPFVLEADKHNDIQFSLRDSDISIENFLIRVKIPGGDISARNFFDAKNFTGNGFVKGNTVYLKGTVNSISFSDATVSAKTELEINSTFNLLEIKELSLNIISLKSVSGRLQSRNTEVTLDSDDITITSPKGKFTFGNGLKIEGNANKISTSTKIVLES